MFWKWPISIIGKKLNIGADNRSTPIMCVLRWIQALLTGSHSAAQCSRDRVNCIPVAQWLEHCVSSAKVVGSIPREHMYWQKKCITWMHCKSLWIKASAKCINININIKYKRICFSELAPRGSLNRDPISNESRCFVPLMAHKHIEHFSNSSYRFYRGKLYRNNYRIIVQP